jgi:hypothetical protein
MRAACSGWPAAGSNTPEERAQIMRWVVKSMMPVLLAGLLSSVAARIGPGVTRTFNAPADRVWIVAESVLRSLGWEVGEKDRAVGWILTRSRGVEFKDFGVYGEGTRHKLRLTIKEEGPGKTAVPVERELYKEERTLWMRERKPLQAQDRNVETSVLDAIARAL